MKFKRNSKEIHRNSEAIQRNPREIQSNSSEFHKKLKEIHKKFTKILIKSLPASWELHKKFKMHWKGTHKDLKRTSTDSLKELTRNHQISKAMAGNLMCKGNVSHKQK